MKRIVFLDGLKGLAALVVVFHHAALAFYPKVYAGESWWWTFTPLNLVFNGNFALVIFLILSGFSLSYKYFLTHDYQRLKRIASTRYFRLMPPILVTNIAAFFLIPFYRERIQEVAKVTGSWFWLAKTWNFEPNFLKMIKQSLFDVYFFNLPMEGAYNTSLWIIPIFFLGTFLVVIFLWLFGKSNFRFPVYGLLFTLLYSSYYLPLILGVMLADWWVNAKPKITNPVILFTIPLLGLYLGSFPSNYQWLGLDDTYFVYLPLFKNLDSAMIYHTLGGFILIVSLFFLPRIQSLLSFKPILFLGKISYPLFVAHAVILIPLVSYFYPTP